MNETTRRCVCTHAHAAAREPFDATCAHPWLQAAAEQALAPNAAAVPAAQEGALAAPAAAPAAALVAAPLTAAAPSTARALADADVVTRAELRELRREVDALKAMLRVVLSCPVVDAYVTEATALKAVAEPFPRVSTVLAGVCGVTGVLVLGAQVVLGVKLSAMMARDPWR